MLVIYYVIGPLDQEGEGIGGGVGHGVKCPKSNLKQILTLITKLEHVDILNQMGENLHLMMLLCNSHS